ncbi:MAG: LptF/LptG family permease [Phycisphaeraceae bacterium]|nr:LptF/LptG family permease [Phycisphaeraceae bacterium]
MFRRAFLLRPPLLDAHVVSRFLANFVLLFALLFVFAISVDVIVQAETFLDAATAAVRDGRAGNRVTGVIAVVLDFHGPRVFQFYQYMLGLVAIGAMGFTCAQMHRFRELTAVMAAGISLRRIAIAILLAAVGLNVLQAINQELILPRLAPMLVRDHRDLQRAGTQSFPVTLTRDGENNLFSAALFDPNSGEAEGLLVIERNERGAALRRVQAERATYDPARRGWLLSDGKAIGRGLNPDGEIGSAGSEAVFMQPVDFVASQITPKMIVVRRFRLYSQMLDYRQVQLMGEQGGADDGTVVRLTLARFAGPMANLLVLAVSIPFFLLREPRPLLMQSVKASAVAVPAMLTALIFLTVPFEDLPAAASVALPIAVLMPAAAWRLAYLRT